MNVSKISKVWFTPVISSFLQQRKSSLLLMGAGAVQVGLVYAHLPGWPCPFKAVFGIPCPGCGLSTACSQLLHGQWLQSFKTHAFAPFFLLGLILVALVCVLPENQRQSVIRRMTVIENRTGFLAWFLLCLLFYWGLRLLQVV